MSRDSKMGMAFGGRLSQAGKNRFTFKTAPELMIRIYNKKKHTIIYTKEKSHVVDVPLINICLN